MTTQMNLQRNVLRYIIVKTDNLPTLSEFAEKANKVKKERKSVLREKGEKIDQELEKALHI
jgi:ribosomal protein S6